MATLTGTVASKARNGSSIKIGEDWYGAFKGKGLETIEQGHNVQVEWDYDKTGKYRNIRSVVALGGTAVARPAMAAGGSGGGYSNLGVELGHASKLAMDLALAMHDPRNVGDDDFYADWIKHTRKVYKAMSALRAEMSKPVEAPVEAQAEAQEESIF
ncbi:MAG: hypothetical protein F2817_20730 [Actinobacteria bacterium]|nr:hypothetical protein [Actinomycetota bacterium]